MDYKQTWTLTPILHGKGDSYKKIEEHLDHLAEKISSLTLIFPGLLPALQEIDKEIGEAATLMACLTGINTQDVEAAKLEAKLSSLLAAYETVNLKIDEKISELSDGAFEDLKNEVPELAFALEERRTCALEKMPLEKETLATALAVSGHTANTTLYFSFMGTLLFPLKGESLPLAKLENQFTDSDQAIRKEAIQSLETVLTQHESTFAHILNAIVDFRLALYKERHWKNDLHASLRSNRMEKQTLDTMWRVVSKNKAPLKKYMDRKAKLLGLKKLSYSDIYAPLGSGDETKISWENGCDKIISLFEGKNPEMTNFIKRALKNGWVDAKPNPTKRAGGFCSSLPLLSESRILMTYMDSFSSLSTLAHELGHAFHSHVLYDKPSLLQHYPMNLAETASTMFEMIVADGAIKEAKSKKEKLSLLDDKIGTYLAFNMDIHSRFTFETALHEKRKKGYVAPEELNALMVESQKIGFDNGLSSYLPHFWAYKMHFYFTDITFYNWPYTFGYLLSLGLYNLLSKEKDFETRYIAFLKDTGSMNVEPLIKKHLGVDLSEETFWQGAIDILHKDIDEFLQLSE